MDHTVRYVASGTMIVIRLDKDKLDPYFLKAYLDSELGRHQIKSITKKQMSNLNLLTINDLNQLKIPKLSIEEQLRIAKIYKEKIREINSAKKILDIANEDYSLTFNELFSEFGS
jgi:type I restriction enzyme M protein